MSIVKPLSDLPEPLLELLAPHGFCHVDGEPTSNDDKACQAIIDAFTPADFAALRAAECRAMAAAARARVTGGASPEEASSWPIKRAEALAFQAGGDAPSLEAEAKSRGVDVAAVAARVLANSAAYLTAETAIAGMCGKHRDALRALAEAGDWAGLERYDLTAGWPEA